MLIDFYSISIINAKDQTLFEHDNIIYLKLVNTNNIREKRCVVENMFLFS